MPIATKTTIIPQISVIIFRFERFSTLINKNAIIPKSDTTRIDSKLLYASISLSVFLFLAHSANYNIKSVVNRYFCHCEIRLSSKSWQFKNVRIATFETPIYSKRPQILIAQMRIYKLLKFPFYNLLISSINFLILTDKIAILRHCEILHSKIVAIQNARICLTSSYWGL